MSVRALLFIALALMFWDFKNEPEEFVSFRFKGQTFSLPERMRVYKEDCWGGFCQTNEQLDTLCNAFYPSKRRVRIIRQDDGYEPQIGLGLLFEFSESVDSMPYRAPWARLQFNDFRFGGLPGSATDAANYTGVTNNYNSELKIVIDAFDGQMIEGRFEGILVNALGGMAPLDEGRFRVKIIRAE